MVRMLSDNSMHVEGPHAFTMERMLCIHVQYVGVITCTRYYFPKTCSTCTP